ncbi:MAG TPA: hypothetical protein VJS44_07780 [Pyrinomonadaceae bacterium]|nr:hypothetical protein [Pyrinomonadaceae bacterium]
MKEAEKIELEELTLEESAEIDGGSWCSVGYTLYVGAMFVSPTASGLGALIMDISCNRI